MELKNTNYIKEIEKYFLKLTGKGLMLSAKDYNIINNWYERSVSKETVLKAIQYSIKEKGLSRLKGISSIQENIENYIKSAVNSKISAKSFLNSLTKNNLVKPIIEKINSLLKSEKDEKTIKELEKIKLKISELKNCEKDNFYMELKKIEKQFLDSLYEILDKNIKQEILNEAVGRLPKESKFFDKESKEKTIKAFRNEIMLNNLNLKNIFNLR
ncbi:MAG: hypothetical protein ACRENO_02110 [Thermodesulfobacteriota bacterium]